MYELNKMINIAESTNAKDILNEFKRLFSFSGNKKEGTTRVQEMEMFYHNKIYGLLENNSQFREKIRTISTSDLLQEKYFLEKMGKHHMAKTRLIQSEINRRVKCKQAKRILME